MSSRKNPLDLNNFPDEYTPGHSERWRGSNQLNTEEASLPAFDALRCRKRKCGVVEGKETCLKVYECRFCSLKFCKSQALGGHMNRHRQERETETLNRARQLVYSNDNMGALNLGLRDQKPGQYFSDSFPHEPSLPYMDSLTMPTPILTKPSPFPSPSPPPPFFSSSPTPPSLVSNNPISLPACFLPLHYSSQILPSRMNDLVNRHHVASGSPHRQLQEQQQNSAARDFLSGLARSGEPVGYYKDKRVSWGSTHD